MPLFQRRHDPPRLVTVMSPEAVEARFVTVSGGGSLGYILLGTFVAVVYSLFSSKERA